MYNECGGGCGLCERAMIGLHYFQDPVGPVVILVVHVPSAVAGKIPGGRHGCLGMYRGKKSTIRRMRGCRKEAS